MGKNQITPFGTEVKKALKRMGVTQGDLAEELGITKQYLYMIFYGMKAGKRYLDRIAEICGIEMPVDDINIEDTKKEMEVCEEACRDRKKAPKKKGNGQDNNRKYLETPLGILVKEALKEKGMKQVTLAKELECEKQYLYMILSGRRSGWKYLSEIARICKIEIPANISGGMKNSGESKVLQGDGEEDIRGKPD